MVSATIELVQAYGECLGLDALRLSSASAMFDLVVGTIAGMETGLGGCFGVLALGR